MTAEKLVACRVPSRLTSPQCHVALAQLWCLFLVFAVKDPLTANTRKGGICSILNNMMGITVESADTPKTKA